MWFSLIIRYEGQAIFMREGKEMQWLEEKSFSWPKVSCYCSCAVCEQCMKTLSSKVRFSHLNSRSGFGIWSWTLILPFRICNLIPASFDSTISSFDCRLKLIFYFCSNQLCSIEFFLVIGAVAFSQGKRKKSKKWCWLQQTHFNL